MPLVLLVVRHILIFSMHGSTQLAVKVDIIHRLICVKHHGLRVWGGRQDHFLLPLHVLLRLRLSLGFHFELAGDEELLFLNLLHGLV